MKSLKFLFLSAFLLTFVFAFCSSAEAAMIEMVRPYTLSPRPVVQSLETTTAPASPKPHKKKKAGASQLYNISFYCPCKKCCGKTNGITASGKKARAHHTVAAPSNFPFGTRLKIEGLGTFVVEDRGGAIKGKRLDVFVESHEEALKLGRKHLKVQVVR